MLAYVRRTIGISTSCVLKVWCQERHYLSRVLAADIVVLFAVMHCTVVDVDTQADPFVLVGVAALGRAGFDSFLRDAGASTLLDWHSIQVCLDGVVVTSKKGLQQEGVNQAAINQSSALTIL